MAVTQTGVEFESEVYEPGLNTHRFTFDQETTSASLAVVTALSEALTVAPMALTPLQSTVDTDALDALVRPGEMGEELVSVSFTVEEHAVTVSSDGTVAVSTSEVDSPSDGVQSNDH